jgi:hypothetical protein
MKGGDNVTKYIARFFVPMYLEIVAKDEKDAQEVAQQ